MYRLCFIPTALFTSCRKLNVSCVVLGVVGSIILLLTVVVVLVVAAVVMLTAVVAVAMFCLHFFYLFVCPLRAHDRHCSLTIFLSYIYIYIYIYIVYTFFIYLCAHCVLMTDIAV